MVVEAAVWLRARYLPRSHPRGDHLRKLSGGIASRLRSEVRAARLAPSGGDDDRRDRRSPAPEHGNPQGVGHYLRLAAPVSVKVETAVGVRGSGASNAGSLSASVDSRELPHIQLAGILNREYSCSPLDAGALLDGGGPAGRAMPLLARYTRPFRSARSVVGVSRLQ